MRFPPSFLDDIRNRVSVSSVIGRKVAWDRRKTNAAKGDYWACCPFHGEKSPSFHADDRKGRYYCFGCKQSGDIFTYLVEKEGVPFPEAVSQLAAEADLTMPDDFLTIDTFQNAIPRGLMVSRALRIDILDVLRIAKVNWSGELDEAEFLGRIFDLNSMRSTDSRFSDVAGDIWQHRVNNPEDWPDDWVLRDKRFNLQDCSSEIFLKFLCETVHPVVRRDHIEAAKILGWYNEALKTENIVLLEEEMLAGRPRYVARGVGLDAERVVKRARNAAEALDAGWMQKEIERMEKAVERDPALAIGTAKDLLETCCKTILKSRNIAFTSGADLPELTKLVCKSLKLVPEGISDSAKGVETIRLILRNLTALTKYIAELRGLYGSGHGRDGKHRGLEPRHARLAVGAAVTFIEFVAETHKLRNT